MSTRYRASWGDERVRLVFWCCGLKRKHRRHLRHECSGVGALRELSPYLGEVRRGLSSPRPPSSVSTEAPDCSNPICAVTEFGMQLQHIAVVEIFHVPVNKQLLWQCGTLAPLWYASHGDGVLRYFEEKWFGRTNCITHVAKIRDPDIRQQIPKTMRRCRLRFGNPLI